MTTTKKETKVGNKTNETNTISNLNTINDIGNNNTENNNEIPDEKTTADEDLYMNEKIHRVDSENEYYTVEKALKNYLIYSKVGNSNAINAISDGQNVFDGDDAKGTMAIKDMYAIDNDNGTTYFINIDLSGNTYYIVFIRDFENDTFKIAKLDNQEYNDILRENNSSYDEHITVSKNKFNAIQHVNMNNSEIVEKYFNSYIQNARYNPEEAYNSLNEEYRNARFGSYNKYKEYLEEENKAKQLESFDTKAIKNFEDFETRGEYEEYMINLNHKYIERYFNFIEGGKQYYVCIDYYGNYYIFEVSGVMNYKLYLDSYTVGLNYFTRQYEKVGVTAEEKGQIVINKIFEALNNKDYEYVYNKLESGNEVYKDYDEFAKTMSNNLFANNHIELDNYTEEDYGCSYNLIITDSEGKDTKELTMSVGIQLQEKDFAITKIILEF